jgi:hypothetical protein
MTGIIARTVLPREIPSYTTTGLPPSAIFDVLMTGGLCISGMRDVAFGHQLDPVQEQVLSKHIARLASAVVLESFSQTPVAIASGHAHILMTSDLS